MTSELVPSPTECPPSTRTLTLLVAWATGERNTEAYLLGGGKAIIQRPGLLKSHIVGKTAAKSQGSTNTSTWPVRGGVPSHPALGSVFKNPRREGRSVSPGILKTPLHRVQRRSQNPQTKKGGEAGRNLSVEFGNCAGCLVEGNLLTKGDAHFKKRSKLTRVPPGLKRLGNVTVRVFAKTPDEREDRRLWHQEYLSTGDKESDGVPRGL